MHLPALVSEPEAEALQRYSGRVGLISCGGAAYSCINVSYAPTDSENRLLGPILVLLCPSSTISSYPDIFRKIFIYISTMSDFNATL
jgi:hypothetical protein